jgi:serine/threonine protein kinase
MSDEGLLLSGGLGGDFLRIHVGDLFPSSRFPNSVYRAQAFAGSGGGGLVIRAELLPLAGAAYHGAPVPEWGSIFALKTVRCAPLYTSQASMEVHLLHMLERERERERGRALEVGESGALCANASGSLDGVVRLVEHFTYRGHLCIVEEFLPGSLLDVLSSNGFEGLPLHAISCILRQLCTTVHALHRLGLAHADVKPENVMLFGSGADALLGRAPPASGADAAPQAPAAEDWPGAPESKTSGGAAQRRPVSSTAVPSAVDEVPPVYDPAVPPPRVAPPVSRYDASLPVYTRLIDFGSAGFETSCGALLKGQYAQTRFYRAPEILLGLPLSGAVDMWGVGCVGMELLLGLPLIPGCDEHDMMQRMVVLFGYPPEWMLMLGASTGKFFVPRACTGRGPQGPPAAEAGGGGGARAPQQQSAAPRKQHSASGDAASLHGRGAGMAAARRAVAAARVRAASPSPPRASAAAAAAAAAAPKTQVDPASTYAQALPVRPGAHSAWRLRARDDWAAWMASCAPCGGGGGGGGYAGTGGEAAPAPLPTPRHYVPSMRVQGVVLSQRGPLLKNLTPDAQVGMRALAADKLAAAEVGGAPAGEVVPLPAEFFASPPRERGALLAFADFIARILCLDPLRRLTAAEALAHPFLSDGCALRPGGGLGAESARSADNTELRARRELMLHAAVGGGGGGVSGGGGGSSGEWADFMPWEPPSLPPPWPPFAEFAPPPTSAASLAAAAFAAAFSEGAVPPDALPPPGTARPTAHSMPVRLRFLDGFSGAAGAAWVAGAAPPPPPTPPFPRFLAAPPAGAPELARAFFPLLPNSTPSTPRFAGAAGAAADALIYGPLIPSLQLGGSGGSSGAPSPRSPSSASRFDGAFGAPSSTSRFDGVAHRGPAAGGGDGDSAPRKG